MQLIPSTGTHFRSAKGTFEVTGRWFNQGKVKSLEITNSDTKELTEVSIKDFFKTESRITYINKR